MCHPVSHPVLGVCHPVALWARPGPSHVQETSTNQAGGRSEYQMFIGSTFKAFMMNLNITKENQTGGLTYQPKKGNKCSCVKE